MGLFSTLAAATSNNEGEESSSTPTSSATIATVVQLYANQQIILMEDTPAVSGYSSLTYQAVQVGASADTEVKHKHSNPDLGVWNCKILVGSKENSDPLVDSLLSKLATPSTLAPTSSVYCVTVDLDDETTVEPTLSALQAALVRHLIECPPAGDTASKTRTTSLYDLQTAQFGLAADETPAERSVEESSKEVKVGLMICAVLSSNEKIDESSEAAYKKKQARALIIYHLRKFATAIHASLCFVERPTEGNEQTTEEAPAENAASNNNNEDVQLSVDYDKLSQLWRDMANGIPVWEEQQTGEVVGPTPLYGPGKQQEDLIETVLLRNANYPGHWDASKDSIWKALPATQMEVTDAGTSAAGDDGWLTQLRDSIASALPQTTEPVAAPTPQKAATPAKKEAEVSDFFASLLKNP